MDCISGVNTGDTAGTFQAKYVTSVAAVSPGIRIQHISLTRISNRKKNINFCPNPGDTAAFISSDQYPV